MDTEEFRRRGKEMVDYICDYIDTIGSRRVTPEVEPGYLRHCLPDEAPQTPESWESIMEDIDTKIMPGVTHWQHPRFHAYFPSGNSYPSILADMLSDAIGCIGFSWAASPVCSELETIVLDWFGKAIALPEEFLKSSPGSRGGGVIQSSASECVLVSMLAARSQAINYLKRINPTAEDGELVSKLVAYCSQEAHSCVEKAAKVCLVKLNIIEPDEKCSLRGFALKQAMEADERKGLFPFFVSAVLGSTASCSFDNLQEIGPVCLRFPSVWLHVDGAYAGNAFICPEYRHLMSGIHFAQSFNTNPNKWLLVNFDCSVMWVKDHLMLTSALSVDPLYLQHAKSSESIDYRHWGIPLSRRFRSLKLWFVFRCYGIQGLQSYIRKHSKLAQYFELLVRQDSKFEICNEVKMGLACFRIKGTDRINQELLASLNNSGKIHVIPAMIKNRFVIRFCVVAEHANKADIEQAWEVIQLHADQVLESYKLQNPPTPPAKLLRRFSFTRSISRELFQRSLSRSSLHDGATPIYVPEDDNDSDIDEEVFQNSLTIKEEKEFGSK